MEKMARMNVRVLAMVVVVGLFLYWIVVSPVGAAAAISTVIDWTLNLLQLVANRLVRFLDALM